MKKMAHLLFVILILAVSASGCTFYQIDSKDTTEDYYPPKTNLDDVAYVESSDKLDKPYNEIGLVTVTTERRQTLEDVLPKLKQEAGNLGADAITDIHSDGGDFWNSLKPQELLRNAYIRTRYTAKAVVWK
jgi:hypothetical protein